MEKLSVASYLYYGHTYHLYAYGDVENIPNGCIVRDASEILPESDVKKFWHIAQFADYFRYKLLLERGGCWSDTDVVCLQPFQFPKDSYVFSTERIKGGSFIQNNNVILNAPQGAEIIEHMMAWCAAASKNKNITYTALGPELVTRMVRSFAFEKNNYAPEIFCPVDWWAWKQYIDADAPSIPCESLTAHLWHEMWKQYKFDTDAAYPESSLYEQWKRKFL
jgi:hypothetical protein